MCKDSSQGSAEFFCRTNSVPAAELGLEIPSGGERGSGGAGRAEGSQHKCGHYHTDRKECTICSLGQEKLELTFNMRERTSKGEPAGCE